MKGDMTAPGYGGTSLAAAQAARKPRGPLPRKADAPGFRAAAARIAPDAEQGPRPGTGLSSRIVPRDMARVRAVPCGRRLL